MQTKISDMSEMNDVPKQRIKIKKKSQVRMIWQNFRKNKLAMFGLCLLIVMMGLSIFADFFFDYKEDVIKQNISERLQLPSKDHLLGTDQFGRDLFARVVYGGRISLFSGVLIVVLSLAIGSIIGSTAGYYGGKIDNFLMRLMDVILAIPSQLLAISIVAALGPSLFNLLIASTASQVPRFSRIIRSSILTEKEMEYIEAARLTTDHHDNRFCPTV
jgi:peptide/nickel transport system permease protein